MSESEAMDLQVEETPAKSTRASRTKKTAVSKTSKAAKTRELSISEDSSSEAKTEEAAPSKPAKRTRSSKAQASKASKTAQAATDAAADDAASDVSAGAARVSAQEEAEFVTDAGASDVAESEGRPKRRTRRSTRATTGAAAGNSASANDDAAANGSAGGSAGGSEGAADTKQAEGRQNAEIEDASESEHSKDDQSDADKHDKQGKAQQNNRSNKGRQRRQHQNREVTPTLSLEELATWKLSDLRARAEVLEVDVAGLKKNDLVETVFAASARAEGFRDVEGVLDILSDGYGFLRTTSYLPGEKDCYVGTSLIKRNGLRKGDYLVAQTRPLRDNDKYAAIQKIMTVNGHPLEELQRRPRFADLTPIYPADRLMMEHGKNTTTARVIDLVAPIGKGQRGLIVSPPKAGKTTILKDIAASIAANNPEVHLMCLLVDERPEEVTDMQRSIKGEVISSTFDMPADNHIAVAEMVIERAKRLVEDGKDVVILLDSITRLARAYNLAQPASGRVLSGGVDSTALYPPKRFLGAARNIEFGGSLTILASALIETGSKMDEVIFEEFKGTGNMELRLDRQLADRRIFPAIDPVASGTRKEELLLDAQLAPLIWAVRRLLANMNNTERAMDMLIKSIKQTDDNQEFLMRTARKAQHSKTETLEI